jgi:cytosine/creatinine deaminase
MQITIHNALHDSSGEIVHLAVEDGKIVSIGSQELAPGERSIDANGAMVSPAFVDPHFHLENSLLANYVNKSGTLREAIDMAGEMKASLTVDDIVSRSTKSILEAIAHGTLWMRSHCDIDQIAKLQLLEGVVAAKKKFEGIFDVSIVAFPQMGMADNPEAVDYMWQAMEQGADIVGGMPHGEKDMDRAGRQIEIAFEMAKKHDADIDMHVDETDDPYWHTLELLADKAIEENYQGRVAAGHCTAMAAWDDKLTERVIEKLLKADLHIISNVPVNLLIQGRGDQQPVRRGIARVKQLLEAGVSVSCGQDDMLNMFYPFGKMDMLEVANFVAHAAHLSSPEQIQAAFDMPRYRAARVLGLDGYGLEVGCSADLVLLHADSALDAVRRQPERLAVIRQGVVLAETKIDRSYAAHIPME